MAITNTKLSQGQVKGTGKAHLQAELNAVESAIAGALGKLNYEGGADISLKDLGEMVDGDAGGMSLKVDVAAAGFDITGAGEMAADTGTFTSMSATTAVIGEATVTTTHAGVLDASSADVSGNATVGGTLGVTSTATFGENVVITGNLTVQGDQTVLNTQVLEVEDDKIVIAKGQPNQDGAGFVLGSDAGSHKVTWSAVSSKWLVSDGMLSSDVKLGGKVLVNDLGVASVGANPLSFVSTAAMSMKDSFMATALDFSKSGEYDAIFGVSGWATGSEGLLGLFTKVKADASSALLAASGSLASAIESEAARALAAESGLQDAIDAEAAARAAADLAHDAAISAETAARIAGDTALTTSLNAEIARAQAAEQANADAITAEAARALAAETAEAAARLAADTALQAEIDAEEVRALAAEAAIQAEVDAEEVRAAAAEAALQAEIDAEEARALAAEGVLQTNIDAVAADLDTEEAARAAADVALQANIDAEAVARAAADVALQAAIDAEVARAQAAELVNANAISTETAARIAGDATLQGNIDTLAAAIATQSTRVFSAVVPNGGVAADADLAGYAGDEFVKPAGKNASHYDMFLNGQRMVWNSDFVFSAGGKVQFKFALVEGDVVAFREH